MKKPSWLPLDATLVKNPANREDKNLVSYLAQNGSVRSYICGEHEQKFYAIIFRGTNENKSS